MRAPSPRRVALLAGATLIAPTLGLAVLSTPASAVETTPIDTAIAVSASFPEKTGGVVKLDVDVTATAPATGFLVTITRPENVGGADGPHNSTKGWDCVLVHELVTQCTYVDAKTTSAKISIAYSVPEKAGGSASFRATLRTLDGEVEGMNNAASTTVNIPSRTKTPGTITGRIWSDVNRNGVRDNGEAGVAGVTVVLYRTGDTTGATGATHALTNAQGVYAFRALEPAVTDHTYSLFAAAPDRASTWTTVTSNDDARDSDLMPIAGDVHVPAAVRKHLPAGHAMGVFLAADVQAGQVLTIDGGLVGLTTGAATSTPTPTPAPTRRPTLPVTGASAEGLAAAGALLAAGGLALTLLARRRRALR